MSTATPKRHRTNRLGTFSVQPGQVARFMQLIRSREVLTRLLLCAIAAVITWGATRAWAPPFSFRTGFVPARDIYVRTEFKIPNPRATAELRDQRRKETPWVYENDPTPLIEMRQRLKERMFQVLRFESYDAIDPKVWREFFPEPTTDTMGEDRSKFEVVREALMLDTDLARFSGAVSRLTTSWEFDGLLEELKHTDKEGSHAALQIHAKGSPDVLRRVEVNRVRIAELLPKIDEQLRNEFKAANFTPTQTEILAELTGNWIRKQGLPKTLSPNSELSKQEIEKVINATQAFDEFNRGKLLALGSKAIDSLEMELLRREHEAYLAKLPMTQRISHSLASFGMYVALFVLCGFYIYHRKPAVIADLRRFSTLLAVAVATIILCWFTSADQWRAEIVPLLLFGMTVAIAYDKELALLLAASVSLVVAFSLEQGLAEFVILTSSVAAAILYLGRIRSRTKLIYVSLFTGVVVMLTTIGVGTLAGQAFGATKIALQASTEASLGESVNFVDRLFLGAGWFGLCSLVAGLLMTGLLPFIERLFDVQTDISLLELGDAAHPLLQELVRRAPGTYNHSINVASIGEAAAEAIGANGLLVRVGAYFHDIGKMLKPQYFVENQGSEGNRHESLAPAMSTLVIIAHVKDGIDLARQHHLPETIVDFIAQHHGTTLVEYFYRRATKQSEEDPDGGEIDEANFRYPGPKPQCKETAVLMISDAVESASRALVDPTPARIENLVHELAMKRLLDGQFDDCGLTLQELHLIEESLVKSVTAVYHGRVKYPEQQTV
jgi:putative nucleotidyltransferase with HDIG domain